MWDDEWDENPDDFLNYRHQRRLSDPSANLNNFNRYGWKTKVGGYGEQSSKARSENEGLDSLANEMSEIEAGDLKDGEFNTCICLCVFSIAAPSSDFTHLLMSLLILLLLTSSSHLLSLSFSLFLSFFLSLHLRCFFYFVSLLVFFCFQYVLLHFIFISFSFILNTHERIFTKSKNNWQMKNCYYYFI